MDIESIALNINKARSPCAHKRMAALDLEPLLGAKSLVVEVVES